MTDPGKIGNEQSFTGSIKLVRATDLEVMCFQIHLPSGYFETTQNPSFPNPNVLGVKPRITEIALLDSNKDVMVIAKAATPIKRMGTQALAVKIDI
jgi:hypothetical protein